MQPAINTNAIKTINRTQFFFIIKKGKSYKINILKEFNDTQ